MEKSKDHFYKALNLNDTDDLDLVDRGILCCITRAKPDDSVICKISLDTIGKYCEYEVEELKDGKAKTKIKKMGQRRIQNSIERLAKANRIKIIKGERGSCNSYELLDVSSGEKIDDELYNLKIPANAKGYILGLLQINLNKDQTTHQPNEVETKSTMFLTEMSRKFKTSRATIQRIEKLLIEKGILKVENTTLRDQETGLLLQNRSLVLEKLGLAKFVEQVQENTKKIGTLEDKVDRLYTYFGLSDETIESEVVK